MLLSVQRTCQLMLDAGINPQRQCLFILYHTDGMLIPAHSVSMRTIPTVPGVQFPPVIGRGL